MGFNSSQAEVDAIEAVEERLESEMELLREQNNRLAAQNRKLKLIVILIGLIQLSATVIFGVI